MGNKSGSVALMACLSLGLCSLCGCLATRASRDSSRSTSQSAASQPPDVDLTTQEQIDDLVNEKPGECGWGSGFYDWVGLGPIGRRIVAKQSPADLTLLKACLMRTDGPRVVAVRSDFPIRSCDYALIIAENLPGECFERTQKYSFGPGTPFERRDTARHEILKRCFGVESPIDQLLYEYLDDDGNSVSEEYRKGNGFP